MEKKLLGEYLIADKAITKQQLKSALARQAQGEQAGRRPMLGAVLVEMGALSQQDLAIVLDKQERDRKASGAV
jgi:hypothetical protein